MEGRLFLREEQLDAGAGLIMAAEKRLSLHVSEGLKEAGISRGEYDLLMGIRVHSGLNVSQMREELGMTVPTFARLLGRLDQKGLLEKKRSGRDGRARLLSLNPQGHALAERLSKAIRDVLRQAYREAGAEHVAGARAVLEAIVSYGGQNER